MKNGLYTRIYKKAFVFVVVLLVFGVAFCLASLNFYKIKADTQYYEDVSQYVVNDWENYTSETKGNITLTNNGDGTITLNGQNSTITQFVLPTTVKTFYTTDNYGVYIALLNNNAFDYLSGVRLYLAYNNGNNLTGVYADRGRGTNTNYSTGVQRNNACLVLQVAANTSLNDDILTPFCYMVQDSTSGQNEFSIGFINMLLGPQTSHIDLTKVNYISSAEQTSLVISTQTNLTFGNELQYLIQYSFEAGDTITVDNVGVTALYIDLLTMTAGNDTYIMRFNNDAQSNDYLSVYLYKNNNYVYLYNDNAGEITAGNITDFRTWGADAISNDATITSGSQYNNNIINKIFVYSTGTNYETGYTNGYRDGYDAGEAIGFEEGTENGYFLGYGEGYDQGAIDGLDTSWLVNLFQAVNTFFDITILPGIKIGTIFAIPFVLSVAWVIIRILRGGGYGD